jgi:hypothetical protein
MLLGARSADPLDGIPGCEPKIGMMARMFGALESIWRDVGFREIGHRMVARLEEQNDAFAIGDPSATEAHAHSPTQRLNVQLESETLNL